MFTGGKAYSPYLSEWINMSVKNDPIIKVPIGGVLELECEAVGSPPPQVKWVHRNNLLQEVSKHFFICTIFHQTNFQVFSK